MRVCVRVSVMSYTNNKELEILIKTNSSVPLQRINQLKPQTKKTHCAAMEPDNVGKNRVIEIIPGL